MNSAGGSRSTRRLLASRQVSKLERVEQAAEAIWVDLLAAPGGELPGPEKAPSSGRRLMRGIFGNRASFRDSAWTEITSLA